MVSHVVGNIHLAEGIRQAWNQGVGYNYTSLLIAQGQYHYCGWKIRNLKSLWRIERDRGDKVPKAAKLSDACAIFSLPSIITMPVAVRTPTAPGGIKSYYQAKIEAAELTINQKTQNLRRLEAQRNALNARGKNITCWLDDLPI